MRSRLPALMLALAAVVLLQGCAGLQSRRVAPLATENSSAHRSMLAQFSPLPWAHREAYDGALLRAPEDRAGGVLWYKP
jgi:hypothetical protein